MVWKAAKLVVRFVFRMWLVLAVVLTAVLVLQLVVARSTVRALAR